MFSSPVVWGRPRAASFSCPPVSLCEGSGGPASTQGNEEHPRGRAGMTETPGAARRSRRLWSCSPRSGWLLPPRPAGTHCMDGNGRGHGRGRVTPRRTGAWSWRGLCALRGGREAPSPAASVLAQARRKRGALSACPGPVRAAPGLHLPAPVCRRLALVCWGGRAGCGLVTGLQTHVPRTELRAPLSLRKEGHASERHVSL